MRHIYCRRKVERFWSGLLKCKESRIFVSPVTHTFFVDRCRDRRERGDKCIQWSVSKIPCSRTHAVQVVGRLGDYCSGPPPGLVGLNTSRLSSVTRDLGGRCYPFPTQPEYGQTSVMVFWLGSHQRATGRKSRCKNEFRVTGSSSVLCVRVLQRPLSCHPSENEISFRPMTTPSLGLEDHGRQTLRPHSTNLGKGGGQGSKRFPCSVSSRVFKQHS